MRAEYQQLKQKLTVAHPDDGPAYTAGKRELIARVLATARIQFEGHRDAEWGSVPSPAGMTAQQQMSAFVGDRRPCTATQSLRAGQLLRPDCALTRFVVKGHGGVVQDVEVIESTEAAAAALDPVRARLLDELAVPASAAGLAARVGIARQKVNYHLKALEAHGLVELSEERRHGGITERVLQASAASYIVSPAAVSASAADPDANADHLSAGYLVALAGRLVREVGALARRADASGTRLPTLTIDTQIGFRSAADRAAFADDLTSAVLDLAARYHHDDGRPHRLVIAAHPLPEESP